MSYKEAKVYRDGYHYVAIPYKENPSAKKRGGVTDLEKDEKKKAFDKANKGIKTKGKKKRAKELITELFSAVFLITFLKSHLRTYSGPYTNSKPGY